MKTDLNSIKKELSRLANVENLKKEINRIAHEVKNFDEYLPLNDQAKERLNRMEKRFRELMHTLTDLQKQIDQNVTKFMKSMRGTSATAKKARSTKKKTARKSSSASNGKAKKTTTKKAASRKGK